MSNNQVVSNCIKAFGAGTVADHLTDDFRFEGTLQQFDTKEAFLEGTEGAQAITKGFTMLFQAEHDNQIVSTYELHLGEPATEASVIMTEINTIRGGKIASSHLLFDGEGFMALLPQQP